MFIKNKKILIIVPAFNEASSIVHVIDLLHSVNLNWDILVINDCSEDNTGELARSTGKALVIDLPINLGIGGCVQTGFKFAKKNNYDVALQFDGDGQHKICQIKKIIDPILSDEADMVIGSRFCKRHFGFKSTSMRRIGIKLFEIVNSFLIKQRITDNTSGFRAYNKKAISFFAGHYPHDYPEPEAIILLSKNGFRIKEVFTEMQDRIGGESSISGFKAFYYMVKVLFSIFINVLRPKIAEDEFND
jgi:glycosyltransferase involved in cell wall biosynthesis